MEKLTMSVEEIANELGVSNTTVYTMVRQKEIPHTKVRGRILFHRPTIEHWLVTNTVGGETK
ncbi:MULTISPECIES: helix-turn-helix domain-containing protein [Lysinibacillus]|uniref:helix-turn-helix domain-containing protein n=1 Tax=Lysinibacillus TaxID=400634 RepID=UPI0004D6C2F0|nr:MULTISPECIES: helix-turn-helix domain-containing protein [Lysinibacillus]AJK89668.1 excisionase [Lysinibacillus fusiformis]KHK54320.1 excisionase [Lysinibacillus sp. A1]